MMSLKDFLTTNYGISLYKQTSKLQDNLCKQASAKNQVIFLTRCIHHGITPRFLQIHSPIKSRYGMNVTMRYIWKLLKCAVKEAKVRFYKSGKKITQLKELIRSTVSPEHYIIIKDVSESCREKKFAEIKTKLKRKFELLILQQKEQNSSIGQPTSNNVKNCVLNLVDGEMDDNVKSVLNLGPKFAVTPNKIPYMEIITIAEENALLLEYGNKPLEAELLRQ